MTTTGAKFFDRTAKVIRVLTVPPIGALTLVSSLYFKRNEDFGSRLAYLLAVLFLSVFPTLAYPLQPILPPFRGRGREGQRSLAILMSVIGYFLGIVFVCFTHASSMLLTVYIVYVVSGVGIALFSKGLHIAASGHACAVAGPVAGMTYFLGPRALLIGVPVFLLVCWSSLRLKRHTLVQFLLGGAIFRDFDGIIYGLIIDYIYAIVTDKIMYGMNAGKLALVVTDRGKETADRIDELVGRGTTIIEAKGGFRLDRRDVVMCACSTKEMLTVERAVKDVDAGAFTVILESNEVLGEGFKNFRVAEKAEE